MSLSFFGISGITKFSFITKQIWSPNLSALPFPTLLARQNTWNYFRNKHCHMLLKYCYILIYINLFIYIIEWIAEVPFTFKEKKISKESWKQEIKKKLSPLNNDFHWPLKLSHTMIVLILLNINQQWFPATTISCKWLKQSSLKQELFNKFQ